ncbi:7TM receptor with intracellular metal dependent phosphohydrolase [Corchorus olitorius]|uniref:7TM receptor with intracellular metal dependent phosphohydrolase n=1 Tax=Corchorus olitorius TaxID=93759 RepID=A0A1R3KSW0_9ROSI|nr:7TM receptor with intracellular metal dependent phosphohydrolase [Corchorus olitorius]
MGRKKKTLENHPSSPIKSMIYPITAPFESRRTTPNFAQPVAELNEASVFNLIKGVMEASNSGYVKAKPKKKNLANQSKQPSVTEQ